MDEKSPEATQPPAPAQAEAPPAATPEAKPESPAGPKAKGKAKDEDKAKAEDKAKDEGKAKPKEGAPAAPSKPSPLPLLAGVVAVALALGAAAGTFLVGPQVVAVRASAARAAAAAAAAAPAAPAAPEGGEPAAPAGENGQKKGAEAKPIVYKIDNLIVNPAGSRGTRFLMASVAVEVPDDKTENRLREADSRVRDTVISVLENQSLEVLTRPGARDAVKAQLAQAIRPLAGPTAWLRVYLPQFVIQ